VTRPAARYACAGGKRRHGEDGNAVPTRRWRPGCSSRIIRGAEPSERDSGTLFARERTGKGQKVDASIYRPRMNQRCREWRSTIRPITGTSRSAQEGASIFARRVGRVPDQRRTYLHRGRR